MGSPVVNTIMSTLGLVDGHGLAEGVPLHMDGARLSGIYLLPVRDFSSRSELT